MDYSEQLEAVYRYHNQSKHGFQRFAEGPGGLDWRNQPNPFRRYQGAETIPLPQKTSISSPLYGDIYSPTTVAPQAFNIESIATLFRQSLALSAWKQANSVRWSLRVNPSSGNLHPTEAYLICGPIRGLSEVAMVGHYAPAIHSLEMRAEIPSAIWSSVSAPFEPYVVLVGLASIHWREAWKYGERAYRYCQLDVGHAIASVSLAAASLGWQCQLLGDLSHEKMQMLMGLPEQPGPCSEVPDCVFALTREAPAKPVYDLLDESCRQIGDLCWQGEANELSREYVAWPAIDEVAEACEKPTSHAAPRQSNIEQAIIKQQSSLHSTVDAYSIFQQRRSAVAFDGQNTIFAAAFYQILLKTLPSQVGAPFSTLGWAPRVHLLLFVHRVEEVTSGLYLLLRKADALKDIRKDLNPEFEWSKPDNCPQQLPLYRLGSGDARHVARQVSCGQDIAADGCFSLGMLSEFEGPLEHPGPWTYPRLYWECGTIGQVLYLEAEVLGLRGTGIGCFFDDPVHDLIGLKGSRYQSLYHFTIGYALEDQRLSTHPPYIDASVMAGSDA